MYAKTYVFGQYGNQLNTDSRSKMTEVTGSMLYDAEQGYGFVTEVNYRKEEALQLPELNSGFEPGYRCRAGSVTRILSDEIGCCMDNDYAAAQLGRKETCLIPLCFKADVERSGNYEITVQLYGKGEMLLFAGSRRLVYRILPDNTKQVVLNCVLNVSDIIPMGKSCLYEHRSIAIAVIGADVHIQTLRIRTVNCPTIYIAGDSTINDQAAVYPYQPGTSFGGWGQMLPAYLNGRIAVSNHAHSGQTVETFRTEGHYAIIQAHIKPGDYFLIQFAHNDQKVPGLKALDGYCRALERFVEEIRTVGAYPILVTPLCRNTWRSNGVYVDFLKEYALACIELGERYRIPVIDLHEASRKFILEQGPEEAGRYFYPKDFTHTNDYGAYLMAGEAVAEYRNCVTCGYAESYIRLARFMADNTAWVPAKHVVSEGNMTPVDIWYEQDKEASGHIKSVEELELMIHE